MLEDMPHEKLALNTTKAYNFVGLDAFDKVVVAFDIGLKIFKKPVKYKKIRSQQNL